MHAEKVILQRVEEGLFHLRHGLTPFVEGRMRKVHGERWLHYASRAGGSTSSASLDTYALLKTMLDGWRGNFEEAFARGDRQKARNFASTALEARNATSHLTLPLQDDEALRYLDAMHNLLRLAKAPTVELDQLKRLYEDQRRHGVAAPPADTPSPAPAPPPAAAPVSPARPRLELPAAADAPAKALRPWVEVALPHPDVLANRFKESEFAADLFAVDSGNVASEDYATPAGFFRITFLTEGLRRILASTLRRLAGTGGDPVIGLQTAFGGGKTHTMLAVYHLARCADLALLEGVAGLANDAGVTAWRPARVAVFVGSSKGADTSLVLKDGPRLHTLWGYLAWRLAGDAGLALVAEAEAARTNPGSELMVEVLKLAAPCVVLLDELVAYARQLPDDRFEAFLSFVQSLTEAAKMVPGALVVGSLPESAAEAGGAKGQAALLRLEKVFGRVQSAWLPAVGDETYEIVRRRLFQPLDADGERAREETVKAFHDLYRKNAAEFPPEAKEARYGELLRLSYPIHPELFDRLSKDWAGLEKFQRTRGVLRFLANVVGVLWQAKPADPLITPARVPVGHERVRASVLYPLDGGFGAVVDSEVDGDGALPARMEAANPARRASKAQAPTRAARAVFLCSAPLAGRPNAGLTGPGLRLACAEPGEQLAVFGEALRELAERATYLYEESGRSWFSTQPTLNRLADERARALPDHEVDDDIADLLRKDAAGPKGGFSRVHAVPDDPTGVDEAQALSLVILGPATPHAGKGVAKSSATDAVADALRRCRASQRRHRNTLLFACADEALLATAREAVRRALAWESVVGDEQLREQMSGGQKRDAEEKAKAGRDGARKAVRSAWSHLLYPFKDSDKAATAGTPFELEHLSLAARDGTALPAAAYDKAKADGVVKEQLGEETLRRYLDPLWPADRPHLELAEVVDWFRSYAYLPKLRDPRMMLEAAVRAAVASSDPQLGYAASFDAATGHYVGLLWGQTPPDPASPAAVLVRKDAALDQLRRPASPGPTGESAAGPATLTPTLAASNGQSTPATPGRRQPTRFYGSVEIDTLRPVKAFEGVVSAIVAELQRVPGAKVKLTLEIEAEAAGGFADDDVGVVRDNARQLKFRAESTGFGD